MSKMFKGPEHQQSAHRLLRPPPLNAARGLVRQRCTRAPTTSRLLIRLDLAGLPRAGQTRWPVTAGRSPLATACDSPSRGQVSTVAAGDLPGPAGGHTAL